MSLRSDFKAPDNQSNPPTDFKSAVIQKKYVDKSLLIKSIIEEQNVCIKLFLRPPGFGKTFALEMLDLFFSKNKKNELGLFKDLAISEEKQAMSHQGQYPVIYLNFKDLKANSYNDFFIRFLKMIKNIYKNFEKDILGSSQVKKYEREKFQAILNIDDSKAPVSLDQYSIRLEASLKTLLVALTQQNPACKPLVLIDAYDAPCFSAINNNFFDKAWHLLLCFLKEGLKNNDAHYWQAILTGVTNIWGRELSFSTLNISIYSFSNSYDEYFGFTYDEVTQLTKSQKLHPELTPVCLKEQYGNYFFGSSMVYSPAIMQHGTKYADRVLADLEEITKQLIIPYAKDLVEAVLKNSILPIICDSRILHDDFYLDKSWNFRAIRAALNILVLAGVFSFSWQNKYRKFMEDDFTYIRLANKTQFHLFKSLFVKEPYIKQYDNLLHVVSSLTHPDFEIIGVGKSEEDAQREKLTISNARNYLLKSYNRYVQNPKQSMYLDFDLCKEIEANPFIIISRELCFIPGKFFAALSEAYNRSRLDLCEVIPNIDTTNIIQAYLKNNLFQADEKSLQEPALEIQSKVLAKK